MRRTVGAVIAQDRTIDDPGRDANLVQSGFRPMSLVKWAFIGVILLPAAELAAFAAVALAIGWVWTVVLFLATSAVGVLLLRHAGRSNVDRFRAAVAAGGIRAIHLEAPGL